MKEKFKGFEIEVDEDQQLKIDNEKIEVETLENGAWVTPLLPYNQYKTLQKMAQDIIEDVPDYDTQNQN